MRRCGGGRWRGSPWPRPSSSIWSSTWPPPGRSPPALEAALLGTAAAFGFALLRIEYALFTTAITFYVVVFSHALGEPAWKAADERAIATALGISFAVAAFLAWGDRRGARAA